MTDKYALGWPGFDSIATGIANHIRQSKKTYNEIYAIPRGGVALGVFLSRELGLPMAKEVRGSFTLVADDICDSGKTLLPYIGKNDTAVLFGKAGGMEVAKPTYCGMVTDKWIEFPWETKELPAEDAVVRMIQAIGDDPTREGLLDTPKRVVKSWKELYRGYDENPKDILSVTFSDGMQKCDEMVICRDIEFYSTCEHHLQPIVGTVHVGYLPANGKVVGLSKLARLVDCFSRRLQIQEKMTSQIAEAIIEHLGANGVGVIVKAKHFCMCARGVNKQNSFMVTSAMLGALREKPEARAEFMHLCEMH